MLIKWVRCEVNENQKEAFSNAQEKWKRLKELNGFIGQAGGWNTHNKFEANIIAFWENEDQYEAFMKNEHDEIFENSKQRNTYKKISVQMFHKITDVQVKFPDCLNEEFLFITELDKENDVYCKGVHSKETIIDCQNTKEGHLLRIQLSNQLSNVNEKNQLIIPLNPTWTVAK